MKNLGKNIVNPETPYFIIYEDKIRRNLDIISGVAEKAGVTVIMAFKANAMWKTFPILREYGFGFAASSMNELVLGNEELHKLGHTYCLAYKDDLMPEFLERSSHITFNSLNQWLRHKETVRSFNRESKTHRVSPGLRVNPHCSVVETDIYNPALPGSRFGVNGDDLRELPDGIEGLHFHQLCESSSYDLEKVLEVLESSFGHLLPKLKWVNMGGGHLMTRKDYDTSHLVKLLRGFKERHPNLEVILEPGSAFMWQTGDLVTSIMDIVEDAGVRTAIIDASFTCHMPDTLEMPYLPQIEGALKDNEEGGYKYNLGGNSCLSGDFKDGWRFESPLRIDDKLTLKDMNHYTTVKTTMFNGLNHPSFVFVRSDGTVEILRKFGYEDYKSRMS